MNAIRIVLLTLLWALLAMPAYAERSIKLVSPVAANVANSIFGAAQAVGDFDGDGLDDVAVGAPDSSNGDVFVYYGNASGVNEEADWSVTDLAGFSRLYPDYAPSMLTVGNFNNDLYDDLVIGAPEATNGHSGEGRVYVYYGTSSGLPATPDWTAESDMNASAFGFGVAAGDVDNDAIDDLVITSYAHSFSGGYVGYAYLFKGKTAPAGLVVPGGDGIARPVDADWSVGPYARFGHSVDIAGDVNNDNVNDIIVGTYSAVVNEAYIYYGVASSVPRTDQADWTGTQSNARYGWDVAGIGDVNNDGIDDVAISRPGNTWGDVFIHFGSATGPNVVADIVLSRNGGSTGTHGFGMSVAGIGDINGDTIADIAVGFPNYSRASGDNPGAVYIYYGVDVTGPSTTPSVTKLGVTHQDNFGIQIAAGYIDNDSALDLVVGARTHTYPISATVDKTGASFVYPTTPTPVGVTFDPSPALTTYHQTSETLTSTTFTVVLDAAPSSPPVRLDFTPEFADEGVVSPEFYVFTADNWYQPVTITVTGVDDVIDDGDISYALSTSITTSDVSYGALTVDDLTITNVDDDQVQIIVEPTENLITKEDGSTATFTVRLDAQPTDTVRIDLSSSAVLEGQPDQPSILFDMVNFRDPQTVTVIGQDDSALDGNITYSIQTATAVSSDGRYVLNAADIGVLNIDDDSGFSPMILAGTQTGSTFGRQVSPAGDVNNDGFADFMVAAPRYSNGEFKEGVVYVYYGAPNGYKASITMLEENQTYSYFGDALAALGDVNGDGFDDIAIGARGYDGGEIDEGRVFVYYGSASGIATVPSWTAEINQAEARFGNALASLDANGDGYNDLLVGAEYYYADDFSANNAIKEGATFLFYGSAMGLADAGADGLADATDAGWKGETGGAGSQSAFYGEIVAAIGDVNCDGYDDFAVGAPDYGTEGMVFVYHGASDGPRADGEPDWRSFGPPVPSLSSYFFGSAISGAGNINADLHAGRDCDDLIIGAENHQSSSLAGRVGRVYVYYGSSTGLPATHDWFLEGDQANSLLGAAAGRLGDLDQDGYDEVMFSAPKYDGLNSDEGWVYIYFGSPSGVSTRYITFFPELNNTLLGGSLAQVGDVNGDGTTDFLIGATGYSGGAAYGGGAYLYLSAGVDVHVWPQSGLVTTEASGSDYFSVSLTAEPSGPMAIALSSSNGAEGNPIQTELNFDAGNWFIPQQVQVQGVDDPALDGDVPYNILIANPTGPDGRYTVIDPPDVSVVNLSDEQAVVTISVTDALASEAGSDTAAFNISRTGLTPSALPVKYTLSGSASNGDDYISLSGVIEIPAAMASVSLVVTPKADGFVEGAENVVVTISPDARYTVGGANSDSASIADATVAGVTVAPVIGLVTSETGDTATFTVVLDSQPTHDVFIDLTSTAPDEGVPQPAQLKFTNADWDQAKTVTVVGQDDALTDPGETYTIQLLTAVSDDPAYGGLIDPPDVSVTNVDDESLPKISVRARAVTTLLTDAANRSVFFDFYRTGDTSSATTVYYEVKGDMTAGIDYTVPAGFVNFGIGVTKVSMAVSVLSDIEMEGVEVLVLEITPDAAYTRDMPFADSIPIYDSTTDGHFLSLGPDVTIADNGTTNVLVAVPIARTGSSGSSDITYEVTGTATAGVDYQHGLNSPFTMSSGSDDHILEFTVYKDGDPEGDETIIVTLTDSTKVPLGERRSMTITITENNVPPTVELSAKQGGRQTRTVVSSGGNVTVTAALTDTNPGQTHTYTWNGGGLTDIDDANPTTFVFSPVGMNPNTPAPDFYKIRLTAQDTSGAPESVEADLLLKVVDTAPVLPSADSDGDGYWNNSTTESFYDTDGDGVPDYLDFERFGRLFDHELQLFPAASNSYVMRVTPGLRLRLGDIAMAAGNGAAGVSVDDIAAYGNGEGGSGTASAVDSVINVGGYFDFEVAGLKQHGDSVKVAIPQFAPLPAQAKYRKYHPVDGWTDFVVDAKNTIASAPGLPGQCPPPGDPAYIPGLTEGHYCIELMIEDGGLNDDDGIANGIVKDPGQIGELPEGHADATTPASVNDPAAKSSNVSSSEGGGGGGALHILLLASLLVVMRRRLVMSIAA